MRLTILFLSLFILCEIHGEEENEKFLCTKAGRYENPKDETCNSFFLCSYTLEGELIQTQYSCPEKSVFSPETALCSKNYTCPKLSRSTRDLLQIEHVNNVHYRCRNDIENDFKCRRSGKYADLIGTSCRRYFMCSLLRSGEYLRTQYECPEGSFFDPRTQKCHLNYECPCQMNSPENVNWHRGERREHSGWSERSREAEINEKWTKIYRWTRIPQQRPTREAASTILPGTDDCIDTGKLNLFKCTDEGLYPDKRDVTCTDYFLCNRLSNGGFLRTKYSCPYGSTFDPHKRNCSMQYVCPCQFETRSTYSTTLTPSPRTVKPSTNSEIVYTTESRSTPLDCEIPRKEFECERAGRFPDRTDVSCNTYYLCEINSIGALKKKRYRCPRCLTFNPALEKCTDNYVCPCSNTEAPGVTSSIPMSSQTNTPRNGSETEKTTQNGSTNSSPTKPNTSESTTDKMNSQTTPNESGTTNDCSIPASNKPFKCQSRGRFPDKKDMSCSSYFICSERKDGSFTKTKAKCPKNSRFDPSAEKCSKKYECPCSGTSGRTSSSSSSTTSGITSSSRKTTESTSITEKSKTRHSGTTTTGSKSTGRPSSPTSEQTPAASSSSTKKSSDCNIPPSNEPFRCILKGRFPNRRDLTCSSYFLCSALKNGTLIETKYRCPKNSLFDPSLHRCSKAYECPCANNPSTTEESPKITTSKSGMESTTMNPTDETTTRESTSKRATEQTESSTDSKTTRRRSTSSSEKTESTSPRAITSGSSERPTSKQTSKSESTTANPGTSASQKDVTTKSTNGSMGTTKSGSSSSTQKSSETSSTCIVPSNNETFRCESKGRFPDRRDLTCSSYFLCSSLNNGTLIKTKYKCPRNSFFDPSLQKCSKGYECPCANIPSTTSKYSSITTKSTEKPTSSSINPTDQTTITKSSTTSRSTGSKSTDSTANSRRTESSSITTTQKDKSTKLTTEQTNGSRATTQEPDNSSTQKSSGTPEDCIIPPKNKPFSCTSKGRFPNRRDLTCSSYFLCSALNNGTLIRTKYNCPKKSYFDPSIQRCSKSYECPCSKSSGGTTKPPTIFPSKATEQTTGSSMTVKTTEQSSFTESSRQKSTITRSTERTKSSRESNPTEKLTTANSGGTQSTKVTSPRTSMRGSSERPTVPTSAQSNGSESTTENSGSSSSQNGSSSELTSEKTNGSKATTTRPASSSTENGSATPNDCIIPASNKPFKCTTKGRFADKRDLTCSSYFLCSALNNGTLIKTKYKCPKKSYFDPSIHRCNKSYKCPCSTATSTTPKLSTITASGTTGRATASKMTSTSTDKSTVTESTKQRSTITEKTKTSSKSTTVSEITKSTRATSSKETLSTSGQTSGSGSSTSQSGSTTDRTSEKTNGSKATTKQSDLSSTQNSGGTSDACIIPPANIPFRCLSKGRFPDRRDTTCSSYFLCSALNNGTLIKTKYKCPKKSYFDPSIQKCSKSYECPCASTTAKYSSTTPSPTRQTTENNPTEETSYTKSSQQQSTITKSTEQTESENSRSTERSSTASSDRTKSTKVTPSRTSMSSTSGSQTLSTSGQSVPSKSTSSASPSSQKVSSSTTSEPERKSTTEQTSSSTTTKGSGTPDACIIPPSKEIFRCTSKGRFADKRDLTCSTYFLCSALNNGTLIKTKYKCPRMSYFDPSIHKCSRTYECPCTTKTVTTSKYLTTTTAKTTRQSPSSSSGKTINPTESTISTGRESGSTDTTKASTSSKTTGKTSTTISGRTSSSENTSSKSSGSTSFTEKTGSTESSSNGSESTRVTSTSTSSNEQSTGSTTGQPLSSPTTTEGSSSSQKGSSIPNDCIIPPSNKPFKCRSKGRFPNKRDLTCSSYFLCSSIEGDIFIKTKHECPRNSYFNPSLKRCSRSYECPCSNIPSITPKSSSSTTFKTTKQSVPTSTESSKPSTQNEESSSKQASTSESITERTKPSSRSISTVSSRTEATKTTSSSRYTGSTSASAKTETTSSKSDQSEEPKPTTKRAETSGTSITSSESSSTSRSSEKPSSRASDNTSKPSGTTDKNKSTKLPTTSRRSEKTTVTESTKPTSTTISDGSDSTGETTPNGSKGSTFLTQKTRRTSSKTESTAFPTKSTEESTGSESTTVRQSSSSTQRGSNTPENCIIPPSNQPFKCSSNGRFPNRRDLTCSSYFLCSSIEGDIFIKTKHECPRNSFFDPSVRRCSRTYECPCSNSASTSPNSETSSPSSSSSTGANNPSTDMNKSTVSPKQTTPSSSSSGKTKPSSASESSTSSTPISRQTESTASSSTDNRSPSAATRADNTSSESESTNLTSKQPSSSMSTTEGSKSSESSASPSNNSPTVTSRTSEKSSSSRSSRFTTSPSEQTGKTESTKQTARSESSTGTTDRNSKTTGLPTGSTKKSTVSESTTVQQSSSSTQRGSNTPENCIIPPSNKPFKCSSNGRFPNRRDLTCSSYFLCASIEGDIFIKTKHECPRNSFFDPSVRRCSRTYECPCSNSPSTSPNSETSSPSSSRSTGANNHSTDMNKSTVSPKQTTPSSSSSGKTKPSSGSESSTSSTPISRQTESTASSSRGSRSPSASTRAENTSSGSESTSKKPNSSMSTTEGSKSSESSASPSNNSPTVTSRTSEKSSSSRSSRFTTSPSEQTGKTESTKQTARSESSTGTTDRNSKTTGLPTGSTKKSTVSESTTVQQSSSSTQRGSNTPENCIIPPSNKPFKCSSNGRFPNRRDLTCSSYFLCASIEGDIFIKTKHECPRNSFFDPSVRRCSRTYECPCSNSPSTSPNSETPSPSSSRSTGENNHSTDMNKSTVSPKQTTPSSNSSGKTKPSSSSESSTSSTPISRQTESTASSSRGSRSPSASTRADNTSSGSESTSKKPNSSMSTTEGSKSSGSDATSGNNSSTVTSRTTEKSTSRSSKFTIAPSEKTEETKSTKQVTTTKRSTETSDKTSASKSTRTITTTSSKISESTGVTTSGKGDGSTSSPGITSSNSKSTRLPTRSTGYQSTTVQQNLSSTQSGSNTPENCIIPPSNKPFKCSSNGRFPDRRDLTCSSYFICSSIEGDIFIKTKHECPTNSYFDPSAKRCSRTYECPCSNMRSTTSTITESSNQSQNPSLSTEKPRTSFSSMSTRKISTTASDRTDTTGSLSSRSSTSKSTEITPSKSVPTKRPGMSTTPVSTGSQSTNEQQGSSSTDKSSSAGEDCIIPSRNEPFICLSKGRFPDRRDLTCSAYFLCSALSNGTLIKTEYKCPRNSYFDPAIHRCSREYNCPCSYKTTSSPKLSSSTTPRSTGPSSSTSSGRTTNTANVTRFTISTSERVSRNSESTGSECITPPADYKFVCKSNGRFPNIQDQTCSSYYLCSSLSDGTFVQAKYRCSSGSKFDPSLQNCSSSYECPCTIVTTTPVTSKVSTVSTAIPDVCQPTGKEFVCTAVGRYPKPGDVSCCTYYSCSKSDNGTIIQTEFSCPEGSSFDPVFKTCSKSYRCPCHVTESPQYFTTSSESCVIPTEDFVCSSPGRFPNRQDVSCCNYFLCSDIGNGTYIRTEYNCPMGKSFDPELKRCSSSYVCPCRITENSETPVTTVMTTAKSTTTGRVTQPPECDLSPENPEHVCTLRGRFKDTKDITCTNYFLCSKLKNGTFIRTRYTCPRFSYFDPSLGLCTTTYKCPCINTFTTPTRSTGRITKIPGTRAPWHINTRKTTQTPASSECVPLSPAISEFACSAEGKFMNPLDTRCTSYIHCVRRASVLVKTVVNCEGMTAFDITLKKCTANAVCKICK
ncbi:serine-rich adhesin for platelets-like [Coccinella septempunctata]|uniref:serine-rich adhesin for platelets-like n=1 Tax=Coccinella septempunctata TaxID=41139 RepID=UPI001D067109|nr:serine-rich adhesin for platelets-like [Coccinella septempunctata]